MFIFKAITINCKSYYNIGMAMAGTDDVTQSKSIKSDNENLIKS